MSNACVPDSVKCLDGIDYEVVKHNAHFEWVTEYENTIKQLSSEVFDTLIVKDEGKMLDIAVKGLDGFQGKLKSSMDALVKQVRDKSGTDERAKSFVGEWAEAAKYHADLKYHHAGGGPNAMKVRWGFEGAIKYIIVCATHLADEGGDDADFKKEVSGYVKDVIIQSLIDHLNGIKSELEALQKTS
ncbi:PREDICTED: uncharacterized protein LOC107165609 [Diuraphis noxia]|uniref:uncharacterized protein LOC107165609 n=1 Tax=Diuraphis noxia TaxID=143948 RepID=UPI0007635ED1|nr:PREDICTED: uncharacterized protein LOC107165609 [Diuraphis noxia]